MNHPNKKKKFFLKPKQYFLFNCATIGLKMFSVQELNKLTDKKKKEIEHSYRYTQRILNDYKKKVMIEKSNSILKSLLPEELYNTLNEKTDPTINFKCTLDFKDLDISKEDVVKLLIEKKVLPENFYELC